MSILQLDQLSKTYPGMDRPAVNNVSFEVATGEFITLLGESGSGKTTLFRLIAGFEVPSHGQISLKSKAISAPNTFVAPEKRGVSMIFQDNALFPHLTVRENISFGVDRRNGARPDERINSVIDLLNIEEYASRTVRCGNSGCRGIRLRGPLHGGGA